MKENLQYLNAKLAAEILCTSPQRLANLRHSGLGPVYSKIGQAIRYRLSDLETYMDSKKVIPAQEAK